MEKDENVIEIERMTTVNAGEIPKAMKNALRTFAYVIFFCLMGLYIASGFAGASYDMNNTIQTLIGAVLVFTLIWGYDAFGKE